MYRESTQPLVINADDEEYYKNMGFTLEDLAVLLSPQTNLTFEVSPLTYLCNQVIYQETPRENDAYSFADAFKQRTPQLNPNSLERRSRTKKKRKSVFSFENYEINVTNQAVDDEDMIQIEGLNTDGSSYRGIAYEQDSLYESGEDLDDDPNYYDDQYGLQTPENTPTEQTTNTGHHPPPFHNGNNNSNINYQQQQFQQQQQQQNVSQLPSLAQMGYASGNSYIQDASQILNGNCLSEGFLKSLRMANENMDGHYNERHLQDISNNFGEIQNSHYEEGSSNINMNSTLQQQQQQQKHSTLLQQQTNNSNNNRSKKNLTIDVKVKVEPAAIVTNVHNNNNNNNSYFSQSQYNKNATYPPMVPNATNNNNNNNNSNNVNNNVYIKQESITNTNAMTNNNNNNNSTLSTSALPPSERLKLDIDHINNTTINHNSYNQVTVNRTHSQDGESIVSHSSYFSGPSSQEKISPNSGPNSGGSGRSQRNKPKIFTDMEMDENITHINSNPHRNSGGSGGSHSNNHSFSYNTNGNNNNAYQNTNNLLDDRIKLEEDDLMLPDDDGMMHMGGGNGDISGGGGMYGGKEDNSRSGKSLAAIAKRFVDNYGDKDTIKFISGKMRIPLRDELVTTIRVDGAAEALNVHVRRIYELIKILEILSLVSFTGGKRGKFNWKGTQDFLFTLGTLQADALNKYSQLAQQNGLLNPSISKQLPPQIHQFYHAYLVNYTDIPSPKSPKTLSQPYPGSSLSSAVTATAAHHSQNPSISTIATQYTSSNNSSYSNVFSGLNDNGNNSGNNSSIYRTNHNSSTNSMMTATSNNVSPDSRSIMSNNNTNHHIHNVSNMSLLTDTDDFLHDDSNNPTSHDGNDNNNLTFLNTMTNSATTSRNHNNNINNNNNISNNPALNSIDFDSIGYLQQNTLNKFFDPNNNDDDLLLGNSGSGSGHHYGSSSNNHNNNNSNSNTTRQGEKVCDISTLVAIAEVEDEIFNQTNLKTRRANKRRNVSTTPMHNVTPQQPSGHHNSGSNKDHEDFMMDSICKSFLQLFLVGMDSITMSYVIQQLIPKTDEKQTLHDYNKKNATKIRRIYDVANVLCSLNLINKCMGTPQKFKASIARSSEPVNKADSKVFVWCGFPPLIIREHYVNSLAKSLN